MADVTMHLHHAKRQPWRMCPNCGALHDGAMGTASSVTEGSVLICIDCGEWGVTDDRAMGGWRRPTAHEVDVVLGQRDALVLIAAAREIAKRKRD